MSDSFGAPDPPAHSPPGDPPPPDAASPPDSPPAAEYDLEAGRHVHQVVSVRLGATGDSIYVARTELILEHSHESLDRERAGDFWDEHARALGMRRPRPAALGARPEGGDRRGRLLRGRDRRPGGPPGAESPLPAADRGGFLTFASKSRMPMRMSYTQLDTYLNQERRLALDVRDPVAISYAAERYNTITAILAELREGEVLDLLKPVLSVSQAAKILGYSAKEVRRLLGQGKINGRKVGSEWRIPLRAVL